MSDDLIAEAITEAFGGRCPDYDKDCWCCKAWQQYDDLKADNDRLRRGLMGMAMFAYPKPATSLNKEEGAET